jgi:hypothetical protein
MGNYKPSRSSIGDITITSGQTNTKTAATHDIAGGSSDTQNVRGGSVTVTVHGDISAAAGTTAFSLTVSSDKVVATDVIVANSSVLGIRLSVTAVGAGSFVVTASNYTAGTIANDSTMVVNWVAL